MADSRDTTVHIEMHNGRPWLAADGWGIDVEHAKVCADIARHLVHRDMLNHPLPWRIEHDWTYEVTSVDGHIIAKGMTEEEAQQMIAFAESIAADFIS